MRQPLGKSGTAVDLASAFPIGVFYIMLFLQRGVASPFFPLWFRSRGYGDAAISLFLAAPALIGLVVGPAIVLLCNHFAWRGTGLALVTGVASVAFAFMVFGTTGLVAGVLVIPLAWIVASSLTQVELPLIDVAAVIAARESVPHYGHYRGLGTTAYMGANLVGGALAATLGPNFIIYWCVAATFSGALIALTMPRRDWNRTIPARRRLPWRQVGVLLYDPGFLAVLIIGGLLELSHVYFYSFSSLLWQSEGMSLFTIGLLRAVCALAEVVFLFRLEPWCRRIGPWRLLLIAASASILRWIAMAFTPPLWAELLLQTLHALSYTGTFVAALHLVEATVDEELFPIGQSVCVAFIGGFVPGVGALLCGMLHNRLGAYGYFAMATSSALALIVVLATRKWLGFQRHPGPVPAQRPGAREIA